MNRIRKHWTNRFVCVCVKCDYFFIFTHIDYTFCCDQSSESHYFYLWEHTHTHTNAQIYRPTVIAVDDPLESDDENISQCTISTNGQAGMRSETLSERVCANAAKSNCQEVRYIYIHTHTHTHTQS
jgi:hypothetical protein